MGQPLSEKRKELAKKYIESEGVNEPVLEELNRLMKPLYYYCIGDYYKKQDFKENIQKYIRDHPNDLVNKNMKKVIIWDL